MVKGIVSTEEEEEVGVRTVSAEKDARGEQKSEARQVRFLVALASTYPVSGILLFLFIGFMCVWYSIPEYFDLSRPIVGVRLKDARSAEKSDAFLIGLQDADRFWSSVDGANTQVADPQQTDRHSCLGLLYRAKGNVFTPQFLATINEFETQLLNYPQYNDFCQRDLDTQECVPIESPLNMFVNESFATQEDIDVVLKREFSTNFGSVKKYFGKEYNGESVNVSHVTRSRMCFGYPLAGFFNRNDEGNKQESMFEDWALGGFRGIMERYTNYDGPGMSVYYQMGVYTSKREFEYTFSDLEKCYFAIGAIFAVLVLYMRSLFLGFFALIQVTLSFPITFYIYRVAFGFELFGALQCLSIFVILGVGADDCFIFTDALKLAKDHFKNWDTQRLMSFAFERAFFTMSVTTLTTTLAFFVLSTSAIPMIRFFGIFSSILLITNFCLCITLYTCVLAAWHRYRSLRNIIKDVRATITGIKETITGIKTRTHEVITAITDIIQSLLSGKAKPAAQVEESRDSVRSYNPTYQSETQMDDDDLEGSGEEEEVNTLEKQESIVDTDERRQVKLSNSVFTKILTDERSSLVIVVTFIVFAIVCSVLSSMLKTQAKSSKNALFFAADNPLGIFENTVNEAFHDASSSTNLPLQVVWGVNEPFMDRTGTNIADERDLGRPLYSGKLDMAQPNAQVHVNEGCRRVVASGHRPLFLNEPRESNVFCFMVAFQLWREARQESFPVEIPSPVAPVLAIPAHPMALDGDPFEEMLFDFFRRVFFRRLRNQVGFELSAQSELRVRFAFQTFLTNLDSEEDDLAKKTSVEKAWIKVEEEINKGRPASSGPVAFITNEEYFVLLDGLRALLTGSFVSIAIAIAFTSAFLLIATKNPRIVLLVDFTIAMIVAVVLGVVFLLGWAIDTVILICLTVLVGFAVDYVVHYAIAYDEAYKEQQLESREERVKFVSMTMSRSIFAGALSTMLASVMLFDTIIVFFSTFGAFLCAAVVTAIVHALIFFPALLMKLGPVGDSGELPAVEKFLERFRKRNIGNYDPNFHIPRNLRKAKCCLIPVWGVCWGAFGLVGFLIYVMFAFRTQTAFFAPANDGGMIDTSTSVLPPIQNMTEQFWYEVLPGEDTLCGRGRPFSFFFKKGSASATSLIVEFEGGGICFNEETCKARANAFTDNVDLVRARFNSVNEERAKLKGLGDDASVFGDAHHLFIPMCTGDYHWGSRTTEYSAQVVVNHLGAVNAASAFTWLFEQIEELSPQNVLLTGVDSGAYGTVVMGSLVSTWLSILDTSGIVLSQFGDGALGLFAPGFLEQVEDVWGIDIETINAFSFQDGNETVNVPISQLVPEEFRGLFNITSETVPDDVLAFCVNTTTDATIADFQDILGSGFGDDFEDCVLTLLEAARNNATNFTLSTGNGTESTFSTDGFDFGLGFDFNPFDPQNDRSWIDFVGDRLEEACLEGLGFNASDPLATINVSLAECQNISEFVSSLPFNASLINISGLGTLSTDSPLLVIPSFYLYSAYRFPEYNFIQHSTAFDHIQAAALATQAVGRFIPGVTIEEKRLWNEYMNTVYDLFLPLMPTNYYHWITPGDLHGFINANRLYRVMNNRMYQQVYALLERIPFHPTFVKRADCREDDSCERGVDVRELEEIEIYS